MSERELERVFEPFFTTREPGSGTGIGLASARRAVRAAGGSITAESNEGEGSRLTVLLPLAE